MKPKEWRAKMKIQDIKMRWCPKRSTQNRKNVVKVAEGIVNDEALT